MKISVIIPVLNEASTIGKLIDHLNENSAGFFDEIIVVDGGSNDETTEIAHAKNAKVVHSLKGRSLQMNKGAEVAKNEILYFLHADSFPPQNFDKLILQAVKDGYSCGCFKMKFDYPHWLLQFSGWLTRFNSSWCRGGDQSLFVKKELFFESGGFRNELVIYEDNEIIKRLRRIGKFKVIQENIITSSRRYHANGVIRLQWIFLMIHLKYRLGTPHDKLLNYYKQHVKG